MTNRESGLSLRRRGRNGAGALALALVLAAGALALAGVLAGAVVSHFLRGAAALALAGVLARAAAVARLAVAVAFTRVEAFTGVLVGLGGGVRRHVGGIRHAVVGREADRVGAKLGADHEASAGTTEDEVTCEGL